MQSKMRRAVFLSITTAIFLSYQNCAPPSGSSASSGSSSGNSVNTMKRYLNSSPFNITSISSAFGSMALTSFVPHPTIQNTPAVATQPTLTAAPAPVLPAASQPAILQPASFSLANVNYSASQIQFTVFGNASRAIYLNVSTATGYGMVLQYYNTQNNGHISSHSLPATLVSQSPGVAVYSVQPTDFLNQNVGQGLSFSLSGTCDYLDSNGNVISGQDCSSQPIIINPNSAPLNVANSFSCNKQFVNCGETFHCTLVTNYQNPIAASMASPGVLSGFPEVLNSNPTHEHGPLANYGWVKVNSNYWVYNSSPNNFAQTMTYWFDIYPGPNDGNMGTNGVLLTINACK